MRVTLWCESLQAMERKVPAQPIRGEPAHVFAHIGSQTGGDLATHYHSDGGPRHSRIRVAIMRVQPPF
jgi:hypothetical protein